MALRSLSSFCKDCFNSSIFAVSGTKGLSTLAGTFDFQRIKFRTNDQSPFFGDLKGVWCTVVDEALPTAVSAIHVIKSLKDIKLSQTNNKLEPIRNVI
jgi:hypothetical protein